MGQSEFQEKSKDIVNKLDCKLESGEKERIIDLGKELENQKTQTEILKQNIQTLGEQKMGNTDRTLKDFLQIDIKAILMKKKEEWDKKSTDSNDYDTVQRFIDEIGQDLSVVCGTKKNDKIMGLQVYVNALNDLSGKHATIPYDAQKYNYKKDTQERLFVDGYLGPHTFKALWLTLFGEDLPKTEIIRKPGYDFDRNEPRIIGKDLSYIPLTLPKIDKKGSFEKENSIEIIDNPKIKGAIELLYLFYDGVAKKDNLKSDLDEEILKIMSDPKLYDNEHRYADPLDGYLQAIKQLNITFAEEKSDLKKGRDIITKFINGSVSVSDAEFGILSTLENDIGVHEYVANYIAAKRIDLSKEPDKSKMDAIKINTADKEYISYKKELDKKWIEQKSIQEKFMLETFNSAKEKATTPELQAELCQMFGVDSIEEVTPNFILTTTKEALKVAEEDFRDKMEDIYFTKRLLESKIRADKSNLDGFGNYTGKDKLHALFADIQGIGYLNPSSENIDTTKFIAQMIAEEAACFAIGAVTAGAGTLILKSVLYGRRAIKIARVAIKVEEGATAARRLSRFNKIKTLYKYINIAEKTVRAERKVTWGGKLINATTFAAKIGFEGVGFYQGTNVLQNMFKDKPPFEGRNDLPENIKSIAMMGALRAVNGLVATKKIVSLGGKEFNVNPFNKLAIKNSDKIFTKVVKIGGESLVGGSAIFTVEHMGDAIIEEDDQHPWTKEEFIQATLMYMMFRGMGEVGKLKITKNKKTLKPEIQKAIPLHPEQKKLTQHPQHQEISASAEQKALSKSVEKKVLSQGNRIKEIETELKPINARLAELDKNGEYNMTEGKALREQKSKLTLERDRLIDNQKTETKKEIIEKEMTPEQKNKIKKVTELQSEIEGQKNELSVAREKLTIAIEKGNTKLEKTLRDQIFHREQDIKFTQAELNKAMTEKKLIEKSILEAKMLEPKKTTEESTLKKETVEGKKNIEKPALEEETLELKKSTEEPTLKKETVEGKNKQRLIKEQNEVQKFADEFDAQMLSDKGITINGKNYKLIYEPNMTQNVSRKGKWKYMEDGQVKTSIEGNAGVLPDNSTGNKIRANYNNLRNQYIESGIGKSLVETKVIPLNKPSFLNWIKENPGIAATGALLVTLGGGSLVYKITTHSDGSDTIDIVPVLEKNKESKIINLEEADNGQYIATIDN